MRRGRTFLDTFAENIQSIVAIDPAERELELRERKMKLDHEEQEFQARQEEKRRRLELEERALAFLDGFKV